MRRVFRLTGIFPLLLLGGCGYHRVGSAAHIPESVQTIAVPFFENRTQFSHTEVALTQATAGDLFGRVEAIPRRFVS